MGSERNNSTIIHRMREIIEEEDVRFALLLCHKNADPDAVCASYALSKLLSYLKPKVEVEVASPESVSKVSKVLLEYFSMEVVNKKPCFDKANVIFMLDTNTVKQLNEWGEYLLRANVPLIVIDHHAPHPETLKMSTLYIYYEDVSSTCEIIYELFKRMNVKFSSDVAEALFLGAAFDTRHFVLARTSTFKMIADLVSFGIDVQKTLRLLSMPMDISERIARLKACQRMRMVRIGDWIIVFSNVSSFQASAARMLIDVGADVAIVGSQKKNELSISIRSSQEFYEKTGIHLGKDVANILGERLQGMGGGHSTSAGVNGVGDLEVAFKHIMKILEEKLGKIRLNMSH